MLFGFFYFKYLYLCSLNAIEMLYYDIHTHQAPQHPEDKAVVNTIVIKKSFECLREEMAEGGSWHSAGIHPWYIYNVREQLECLQSLLDKGALVAVGEAGFDKLAATPMALQQEVFIRQVRMAETYRKPLVVHCVKAWQELIAAKRQIRPSMPWIIHGFRGNGKLAEQLVAQGFYLSFGERFNPLAVHVAWPSRLLAETDDSEIDIRAVYSAIATSLSVTEEELAFQIEKAMHSLFPL